MLKLLRWDERETYEKIIMSLLALALILAVIWFVAISPVLKAKSDAETKSRKALRDYNIVSQALPQLGSKTGQVAGASFSRSVLIASARTQNVRLTRVQPDGDDINVWIDDVETGRLYGLINALLTENGATLSRATITTGDNRLLSAQLTLQ